MIARPSRLPPVTRPGKFHVLAEQGSDSIVLPRPTQFEPRRDARALDDEQRDRVRGSAIEAGAAAAEVREPSREGSARSAQRADDIHSVNLSAPMGDCEVS